MTADDFLNILEKQAILPAEVLTSLRQQVQKSTKAVTADSIAKLLIDKKRLTADQAALLLKPATEDDFGLAPLEDELGLAPLDEHPKKAAPAAKPQPAAPQPASMKTPTSATSGPTAAVKKPTAAKPVAAAGAKAVPTKSALGNGATTNSAAMKAANAKSAPANAAAPVSGAVASPLDEPAPLADLLADAALGEAALGASPLDAPLRTYNRRRGGIPKLAWIGGGIGLTLVLGLIAILILTRSNGDREWKLAETDFTSAADQDAINKLSAFVDQFPNHPKASLARVDLGIAKLRLAVAKKAEWDSALATAREVLPPLGDEADFPSARDTLAKILPEIAFGLAAQAREGTKGPLDQRRKQIERAREGLALVEDWRYVPEAQKPWAKLQTLENEMATLGHSQRREAELAAATSEIHDAITQEKVTDAMARLDRLIGDFPELRTDAGVEIVRDDLAHAEMSLVKIDAQPRKAETTRRPSAVAAAIHFAALDSSASAAGALANPASTAASEGQDGSIVAVPGEGVIHWLSVEKHTLVGRQYVGFDAPPPLALPGGKSAEFLVFDAVRFDLMRCGTGADQLRWRLPVGEPLAAAPRVIEGRAIVATRSGKLLSIDVASGELSRTIQLPERLSDSTSLCVDNGQIYIPTQRGNVFVLGAKDFKCSAAFPLESASTAIGLSSSLFGKNLIGVDAANWDQSRLLVFAPTTGKIVQEFSIAGHISSTPKIEGERMFLATDRGAISVWSALGEQTAPLEKVSETPTLSSTPRPMFLTVHGASLALAGAGVLLFDAQAGAAPRQTAALFAGDDVVAAVQWQGDTLLVARRRANRPGLCIAGLDGTKHSVSWETIVGAPWLGELTNDEAGSALGGFHLDAGPFLLTAAPAGETIQNVRAPNAPASGNDGGAIVSSALPWSKGQWLALAGSNSATGDSATGAPGTGDSTLSDSTTGQSSRLQIFSAAATGDAQAGGSPAARKMSPWSDAATGRLIRFGDGVLIRDLVGQFAWIDPLTGRQLASPFLPPLASETAAWKNPVPLDSQKQFVVANGRRVFLVEWTKEPVSRLTLIGATTLESPVDAELAALGEFVLAADRRGTLSALSLAQLKQSSAASTGAAGGEGAAAGASAVAKSWPLDGQANWGPYQVGKRALIGAGQEIFCFDSKPELAWKKTWPGESPIGKPLEMGGDLFVSLASGTIVRLDATSGEERARFELGEPLAGGAVPFGKFLAAPTHDGGLSFIRLP